MTIKKEDLINDVIQEKQYLIPIFLEHGLHCIGCHVSLYESIEQGAQAHGLSEAEISNLVDILNKEVEKEEKSN